MLRAWVEATQRSVERYQGDFSGEPSDPLLRSALSTRPDARKDSPPDKSSDQSISTATLVERLLAEKRGLWPTTIGKYHAAAKLFDQITGTKAVGEVTRQHVVQFKNMLVKLPVNWTKRFPGMTPQDAIEANERLKLPTLAPRNINDSYLTYINSAFKWAVENDLLRENPAINVAVAMPKGFSRRQQRELFTPAQLERLFTSPLYTGCRSAARPYEPGEHLIRDHRYWAPLLALWSGARLNELGQLEVNDIQKELEVWRLRITTQTDEGADEEVEKVLKTAASKRLVPVHPELIRLGFLEHGGRASAGGRASSISAVAKGE